jgi:hypothetical protein
MKTSVIPVMVAMVLGFLVATAALVVEPQSAGEQVRIEDAARDYIDGWYEGNAERMQRALHPDLVKRAFFRLPNGRLVLETGSADTLVELTRAGFGKRKAKPDQKNQVIILDSSGNMASVKTISPDYVDYLHMAQVEGAWKVVNVLWEPVGGKPLGP